MTVGIQKKSTPLVQNHSLKKSVEMALERYFDQLEGYDAKDVYQMVIGEVEQSLFEFVMQYTQGNQSRAAALLGINRGTLRKKLKECQLI